ncbi:MAG: hypothetical protein HZB38_01635 [Planctomycetes bacterium]|nr:hypothetical protein [Planctomycetota bacterium]
MLSRLTERILGWVGLAVVVLVGIAIYQMPAETKSAIWSGFWRSLVWLAVAAAVPWSAALYIRRVVEFGSNAAGVLLVAGLSVVDVVAGIVLMSEWPSGGWSWAAAIGAVGVAGTYNYLVAEYLAERAG